MQHAGCGTGNSVCTYVHGFEPYFYIEAPRSFGPDDCDSLCAQLNVRFHRKLCNPIPSFCSIQTIISMHLPMYGL